MQQFLLSSTRVEFLRALRKGTPRMYPPQEGVENLSAGLRSLLGHKVFWAALFFA